MKIWNGRAVHAEQTLGGLVTGKPVKLMMPVESARKLALCIRRLKNTTSLIPPEVEEIADAIDFLLVGDPGSYARHQRMEAGKGMEPAGDDPSSYAKEE